MSLTKKNRKSKFRNTNEQETGKNFKPHFSGEIHMPKKFAEMNEMLKKTTFLK